MSEIVVHTSIDDMAGIITVNVTYKGNTFTYELVLHSLVDHHVEIPVETPFDWDIRVDLHGFYEGQVTVTICEKEDL